MDEVDRAIADYKPDRWKGYTIGDPLSPSKAPWRLDDEKLMYPLYEKAVKSGISTICIHKGLLPLDYESPGRRVEVRHRLGHLQGREGLAADQLRHLPRALRPFLEIPTQACDQFEKTGRIHWATRSGGIPQKYGVTNVYAELGTTFANSAVAHPDVLPRRWSAVGQGHGRRPRGVGHGLGVVRLAAVADRGDAPPGDPGGHQKKYGFAPLGGENSPIKQMIFCSNARALYGST